MTDLNEMWEALAEYQPYADKRGFGAKWERMTTERTEDAANAAMRAAAAWGAPTAEGAIAWDAAGAAYAAGEAADWAQRAIENIRKAIKQEQT